MSFWKKLFGGSDRGGVSQLAKQLRKETDSDGQIRTLDALVAVGSEDAQRVLLHALRDSRLRKMHGPIMYRFASFEMSLARAALLQCLADPDWYISGKAADVICERELRDPVLTAALVSLLQKASGSKSEALASGLPPGFYTGQAVLDVLNNPGSQGRFVIIGVIKALAKLREPTAVEPLRRIAAHGDTLHPDVLYNAEQALAAISSSPS